MSKTYNVTDIVGKDLYAKSRVEIKNEPFDDAPAQSYVDPGGWVGNVFSYLDVAAGRSTVYWMFENAGRYYYAAHEPGLYDLNKLKEQGVLSEEEKSTPEWLRQAKPILIGAALTIIAAKVLPEIIKAGRA